MFRLVPIQIARFIKESEKIQCNVLLCATMAEAVDTSRRHHKPAASVASETDKLQQ